MSNPISLKQQINLYPNNILNDGLLFVNISEGYFPDREYCIYNQTGNIIRKGMIEQNTSSFSLRVIGLKKGIYNFIMCNQRFQFIINQIE